MDVFSLKSLFDLVLTIVGQTNFSSYVVTVMKDTAYIMISWEDMKAKFPGTTTTTTWKDNSVSHSIHLYNGRVVIKALEINVPANPGTYRVI